MLCTAVMNLQLHCKAVCVQDLLSHACSLWRCFPHRLSPHSAHGWSVDL